MRQTMYATILFTIFMTACAADDLTGSAAQSDTPVTDDNDPSVAEADTSENLATPENPDAGTRKTHSYKVTWTFKSRDIQKCVIFTATGKFQYVSREVVLGRGAGWQWHDQKILDPSITAEVHDYAGGSCIGPATLTKLTMGQFWTGHACSFNPSLSVSIPWGISFGAWPSCGDRKQAGFSTTYNTTAAGYEQHNSGSPVTFGDYTTPLFPGLPVHKPCYGVFASGVAFVKGDSDSFGANHGSSSRQICLTR